MHNDGLKLGYVFRKKLMPSDDVAMQNFQF